jgi:hypothetical protein
MQVLQFRSLGIAGVNAGGCGLLDKQDSVRALSLRKQIGSAVATARRTVAASKLGVRIQPPPQWNSVLAGISCSAMSALLHLSDKAGVPPVPRA